MFSQVIICTLVQVVRFANLYIFVRRYRSGYYWSRHR